MKHAFRAAVPALVVVLVTTVIAVLANIAVEPSGFYLIGGIAAALGLALVAILRRWQTVPWLPLLALIAASAAYLLDSTSWMNWSFIAFTVLLMIHELRIERPARVVNA